MAADAALIAVIRPVTGMDAMFYMHPLSSLRIWGLMNGAFELYACTLSSISDDNAIHELLGGLFYNLSMFRELRNSVSHEALFRALP